MATNTTISKTPSPSQTTLQLIPLADIAPDPQNPRGHITAASLKELTASIQQQGVLQPILVRAHSGAGKGQPKFLLIAGERRWRAAQKAGLTEIPAQVKAGTDGDAQAAQLIENLQREDIHPLDEAAGFLRLQTAQNLSVREVAARVAKDARYVARRLALTTLIAEAQEDFRQDRITLAHALEIGRLAPDIQPHALAACYEANYTDEDSAATDKTRPARPVHVLLEWLKRNVHLNLLQAPFALDDPRLRADGLTCLACPQRSGCDQTLFADIQERDTCLNPLCFQGKVNAFVTLRKAEVEAKRHAPAVLISAYYGKQAEGDELLGRDAYQPIARKAERCAFAEPAVYGDSQDIGKEQWICRDATCKDHRGRVSASDQRQTKGTAGQSSHQQRRQELFDMKVDEAVRLQVMRAALPSFTWPLARTQWHDIAVAFWRRIPSEHQLTIGAVLGWREAATRQVAFDEAALTAQLAALSDDAFAQFLMLCSFAHYGANRDRRGVVDQSAVLALSQACGVNHRLIDATVRAEFCPKKYKAAHQAYLTAVQEGKKAKPPCIYEAAAA